MSTIHFHSIIHLIWQFTESHTPLQKTSRPPITDILAGPSPKGLENDSVRKEIRRAVMMLVRIVPREKEERTVSELYFCHWAKLIGGWLLLGYKSEDGVKAFPKEFSFQFSFPQNNSLKGEGSCTALTKSSPLPCQLISAQQIFLLGNPTNFSFQCCSAEKELIFSREASGKLRC